MTRAGPSAGVEASAPARAGVLRWGVPLSVALVWGINVPVMKAALAHVTPFAFNALRLTLSAATLGIADRLEARARADIPARLPWRTLLGLALLVSLLYQVLFIEGIAHTSASHTGFLIASGPLWTALLATLAGVERPARRAWLGLALAFAGTTLVTSATGGSRSATFLGNALVLLAMLAWAAGTVWIGALPARISATRLAFLTTLVALPGHWLLASRELAPLASGSLGGATWAAIAYSGVFSTGVAYALWNWSVRESGPSRTAAYTSLVPVCALLLAWILLDERPTAVQLAGGSLILLGLGLWRARR